MVMNLLGLSVKCSCVQSSGRGVLVVLWSDVNGLNF